SSRTSPSCPPHTPATSRANLPWRRSPSRDTLARTRHSQYIRWDLYIAASRLHVLLRPCAGGYNPPGKHPRRRCPSCRYTARQSRKPFTISFAQNSGRRLLMGSLIPRQSCTGFYLAFGQRAIPLDCTRRPCDSQLTYPMRVGHPGGVRRGGRLKDLGVFPSSAEQVPANQQCSTPNAIASLTSVTAPFRSRRP